MRLLDLFCGAGGAAMGYRRAGFDEIVGVDIKAQPRYPFEFIKADATTYPLDGFDAIHASPPCQRFSKSVSKRNREKHPDHIAITRERLIASGVPYVIENVPGAPLIDPITLCGTAFGRPLRRHRFFESNVKLVGVQCAHENFPPRFPPAWNRKTPLRFVQPSGGWTAGVHKDVMHDAMGIDWMKPGELSESIPPYYTKFIGRQILWRLNGGIQILGRVAALMDE